ncbi:Glycosyl hydrolase family 109 protein 1 [Streptomyces sp. RB5]|uniref:Glycosyl hydrolase family 109 protein n=1 Tax=Streptomyces smaragdinus TaxID=2585196 RepID=A0A7K0CG35_9ACTN|nr:Gfo/Idh/MocA family oxidoreductase [Streptomyces smaragdinus]MQY11982.1 Glycosyl hydrolase family 109 protein 1 [Streptomyces smaragdinus]
MPETPGVSRRAVLGGTLATGAVAALGASAGTARAAGTSAPGRAPGQQTMVNVPFDVYPTVRIGVIGLGNRGSGMTDSWAAVPGAVVRAVCDIRPDRAKNKADALERAGRPRPLEFGGSRESYQEMLRRDDIDLVYIASPWEFHFEHGHTALLSGKHVLVELPIATELSQLWDLVDASERNRRHLMLSENCSYGRNELAMLKMAHDGVFGEITNGHGGYLHDLRALLFDVNYYTDSWRRLWHTRSTASFYPMHGLAPIAAAMDINRGDRMVTLSATASAPKGLADYRARFMPDDHPSWGETYINGDRITCMIETADGRLIRAEHDVSSARPYSRINSLAGSRGLFEDYAGGGATGARVYVEPLHSGDAFQDFTQLRDEYDHWLWKKIGDDAEHNGGHGGMDWVLQWRIIQLMRTGQVPDFDVYDSAAWCSPVPLSVMSLADKGRPVQMPDFTRGRWSGVRLGLDSRESEMPPVG